MAYMITSDCIQCGVCESTCDKNSAISEGDTAYVIDPEKCTECVGNYDSPRCPEVCAVEAIVRDPVRTETRDQLMAKWQRLHA